MGVDNKKPASDIKRAMQYVLNHVIGFINRL